MFLYHRNMDSISYDVKKINKEMKSWSGGDVFSASWGGNDNWLVSGLGSGDICSGANHMSLGLFNGSNFIDLSTKLPCEDYILYSSAWNGHYWLIGGGYLSNGALYSYTPSNGTINSLSSLISSTLGTSLPSVTSIGWNGTSWLIGGMGFLAELQAGRAIDLTKDFNSTAPNVLVYPNSVNSIIWDSSNKTWYFGGGLPMSLTPSLAGKAEQAWLDSYTGTGPGTFADLTSKIPADRLDTSNSAILSLSLLKSTSTLVIGGYSTPAPNQGMLLFYDIKSGTITDESSTVSGFGYVDWVGAS
jgi:hypothetical protein